MTECKHIQEMLPAFLEGVLSPDAKRHVLEHLATCRACSAALEDLKKVAQLIQGLDETEPPPWFTQKIMAKVREEAARSPFTVHRSPFTRIISRLFYPLRVKVPIQALASVLIVVLAVYVYRSVEPEMRVVRAPSEVAPRDLAVPKNEAQQQYDKVSAGTPKPENESVTGQRHEEAAGTITDVPRTEAVKKFAGEEAPPSASLVTGSAKAKKQEAVADRQAQEMRAAAPSPGQKEPPQAQVQAQKAPPPLLTRREAENKASKGVGATMKEESGSAVSQAAGRMQAFAAKKAEATGFILRVKDVTAATGEIKSLLSHLSASAIAAESRDGSAVITAELAVQRIEELSKNLTALGQVEEEGPRPAATEGMISIRIEVTSKP